MNTARNIVIVESPAKAKTINKYLGDDYFVTASFGHIRDLPSKNGSVNPDDDFAMLWEVDSDSQKRMNDIVKHLKGAEKLILSTDPDREGEAISWHLLQVLTEKKALKNIAVERVTFNEITKNAVLTAMQNPRKINQELVDAYLARRALDYLVGFNLSPVLWRKLPGARSAGRVQSVALRLITQREQEIEAFIPQEYWSIDAVVSGTQNEQFKAKLVGADNKKIQKMDISNKDDADNLVSRLKTSSLSVTDIEAKPVKRYPAPPFITSTLQQEASRKLGFAAARTMSVAQKLYEAGHITYMRTDGVTLSNDAITNVRDTITKEFGKNYTPENPVFYKSKVKNAQEAHEAVRPTDASKNGYALGLDDEQLKLYTLIRNRTLACQMSPAVMERTTVTMHNGDKSLELRTVGSVITFDGFLKLYREGLDDEADEENRRLPKITTGESLLTHDILPEQHFTEPAPRFGEASLVKKMEELGIGRPSTYASVLTVLKDRNYVKLEKGRFIPEDKGRIVTCFLEDHFKKYVEYDFTADLEEKLDVVSSGMMKWKDLLRDFWTGFKNAVDETMPLRVTHVIDRLNEVLGDHVFAPRADGQDSRLCTACNQGTLSIRLSKFGAFVGCSRHPDCGFTRSLTGDDAANGNAPASVGMTESGEEIMKKTGRFGPYLEVGKGKDAKRAGIPKHFQSHDMTEPLARQLLSLPRIVGQHPETQKDIVTGFGRFGAYIAHDGVYAKLPAASDVLEIGLNHAVTLLAEKADKPASKTARKPQGKSLGIHGTKEIFVLDGRYGAYVTDGKINATLPKDIDKDSITLEQAADLIDKKSGSPAKPKKTAVKKAVVKKTTVKKDKASS